MLPVALALLPLGPASQASTKSKILFAYKLPPGPARPGHSNNCGAQVSLSPGSSRESALSSLECPLSSLDSVRWPGLEPGTSGLSEASKAAR
eukprot:3971262-Amphidinium_carterae.1